MGRKRHEPVNDLAALRMDARVDCGGSMMYDFQTAQGVRVANAKTSRTKSSLTNSISRRYYLADARFLVGLEGDDHDLLRHLYNALRAPHWPLYLGRKAFVPGEPVWLEDGLKRGIGLESALKTYPWLGNDRRRWERLERVRVVREDPDGSEVRPDQPISFAERRFAPRRVRTGFIDRPPFKEESPCTSPA
jgi:CRISPR system Cascade subunit CasD